MPYSADLRCSYLDVEMNFAWVYEALREAGWDLTFHGDTKGQREDSENVFQERIEYKIQQYVVFKMFGHKMKDVSYEAYEGIWDYIVEMVTEYAETVEGQMTIQLEREEDEAESTPVPASPLVAKS
jgi:hypothetical protein